MFRFSDSGQRPLLYSRFLLPAWTLVLRHESGQLPPNSAVMGQVLLMIRMVMARNMNRHPQLRIQMMETRIHRAKIRARAEAVGNHLPAILMMMMMMMMMLATAMTREMMTERRARRTRRRKRRTRRRRAERTKRRRRSATRSERVDLLLIHPALHPLASSSSSSSERARAIRKKLNKILGKQAPAVDADHDKPFHFLRVTGTGAPRFGRLCVRRPIDPMMPSSGSAECGSQPSRLKSSRIQVPSSPWTPNCYPPSPTSSRLTWRGSLTQLNRGAEGKSCSWKTSTPYGT